MNFLFVIALVCNDIGGGPCDNMLIAVTGHAESEADRNRAERSAAYNACLTRAERTGRAVYVSDGHAGCPLPAGHYELIRDDGDVLYRKLEPVKLKIKVKERAEVELTPNRDSAMRIRQAETECST